MASNAIAPVSSPASSHELAHFLSADGVGAGFVRHQDIWWNNDDFLGMVWAVIKAPRKEGTLMKLLYIRHTVIETELVIRCCTERLRCTARCGVFPDGETRVTSMTFRQARHFFTSTKALCENMVVLVDGTFLETVDTEIAMGLINQSINPASCVKVLGLYSEDWDDEEAERAVPLFSPLFKEVGIQKLSVAFVRASVTEADPDPIVVDHQDLLEAIVECQNQGKHVAIFLPRAMLCEFVRQIKASSMLRADVTSRQIFLTSETSMERAFDTHIDIGQIFRTGDYLFRKPSKDTVQICSVIVAFDSEAGFTTMPVKRVGLVVYSHVADRETHVIFKEHAGVTVHTEMWTTFSSSLFQAQHQLCRGVEAKRLCLYKGRLPKRTTHPADHSKEFAFELIRGWPGKSMADIPLNLTNRDAGLLRRTLGHLAVAGMIEPYQNGFVLSKTKGAEMTELLPIVEGHGMSFELTSLLASVRHCVSYKKSMRILIRLAVLGGRAVDFLSGLDLAHDETQNVSWAWMEEARRHTAGPARGQMATGRLWFALGVWDKLRNDTLNFIVEIPECRNGEGFTGGVYHQIQGIGTFDLEIAVDIYKTVLEFENRIGLPPLAPSDPGWEQPLDHAELENVRVQLMLAFVSNLAIWDLEADKAWLLRSGHAIHLAPSSLVADPREAGKWPEKAYLILPDLISESEDHRLVAESASCMGISFSRIITKILGQPIEEWAKWL